MKYHVNVRIGNQHPTPNCRVQENVHTVCVKYKILNRIYLV